MNERIRELANMLQPDAFETYKGYLLHAGDSKVHEYSEPMPLYSNMELEKFAELIVRECVEQIQICSEQIKNDDVYADDNIWPIMQSIVDAVAIDVKEHFGVE